MKKALILSAGLGTRLGDLTQEIPKPMLPIHGEPLLARNIRYLAQHGYTHIAINLHYKAEVIQSYFDTGDALGVKLHYVHEPELLGTAGAVRNLKTFFSDVADFLVMYGDLLINQDIAPLEALHVKAGAVATLLLHQRKNSNSLVQLDDDGRIIGFIERPDETTRQQNPFPLVNSGLQLLNQSIFDLIPPTGTADLPRHIYSKVYHDVPLYGYRLTGYRCAIDSPARYQQALQDFEHGRYQVED